MDIPSLPPKLHPYHELGRSSRHLAQLVGYSMFALGFPVTFDHVLANRTVHSSADAATNVCYRTQTALYS